jgi:hypothetical protein
LVPDEAISPNELRRISVPLYGMIHWGDLFAPRQALALSTLGQLLHKRMLLEPNVEEKNFNVAVKTCLALVCDRLADAQSSLTTWSANGEFIRGTFARQALGMVWDFAESNPWAESSGNWAGAAGWVDGVLSSSTWLCREAEVQAASATRHPLPNSSIDLLATDPPYYDAVPYAHLSDFFYVWLRRNLTDLHLALLAGSQVPKDNEIVVDRPHSLSKSVKDILHYERELGIAFSEGRRAMRNDGIGIIVFASKTTESWEAVLQAVISAAWTITGSWPIDTEREARTNALGTAALASSVHLVCRPRTSDEIGDWRDVLSELPQRMHEWMPRLASEGVVGADAIFACLGPALEIFSRYSRVEKANGDAVPLKEYLEHVWAAVSKEALSTIFRGADASGLEPDARLTAMWLWSIGGGSTPTNGKPANEDEADEEAPEEEETTSGKAASTSGFAMEFDAARKIAQGLGIHLEHSESIVEVKGNKARLLAVEERTKHLFGKDSDTGPTSKKSKKPKQRSLFEELDEAESTKGGGKELKGPPPGTTALDRLHQAMILFGAQRGEFLKRFLVEDGVGKDARFWKLAQSLAALYPTGTDERRWVEGVLARKKGLGL